jgi:hypothetical protein
VGAEKAKGGKREKGEHSNVRVWVPPETIQAKQNHSQRKKEATPDIEHG